MKKYFAYCFIAVMMLTVLSACGCDHEWVDANCDTPKTCALCSQTEGEALGHTWLDATCAAPKTCSVCALTDGNPLPHSPGEEQIETNLITAICSKKQSCTGCGTILNETETAISLVGDGVFLLSVDDFVKRLNYIYAQAGEGDWSSRIDYAMNGEQPFLRVSYRGVEFLTIDFFVRDPDPITFSRMTIEHMDDPVIKEVSVHINYWAFVGYSPSDPDIPDENILAMCELYEDDAFSTGILLPIYTALDPTLTADQINASILRGRHVQEVTDTKEYYYNEKCGDLYVEYVDFFDNFFFCATSIVTSEYDLVYPFE